MLKKLHYKQGHGVVLNAPEGFSLGIEPEEGDSNPKADFVLLFVHDAEQVREWVPKVVPTLAEDGVFWITYPKRSSKIKTDINRDSLWKLVESLVPYRPVSNVAVDHKWSALRFRHKNRIQSKKS
ncbi:hypothetical protein [Paenibacillus dendrobii]|uniref:hypothetical protein n=1 Tax=Paenibacillus dendrobii TaxID=2691084 RepID=UPI001F2E10C3|nr:hypothetical protein [Paenibacillus dendrobii]